MDRLLASETDEVIGNEYLQEKLKTCQKDLRLSKKRLAQNKLVILLHPLNDVFEKAIKKAGGNPHLELTMRLGKSFMGVMEHLNTKWEEARKYLPKELDPETAVLQLYPYAVNSAKIFSESAWNMYQQNQVSVKAKDVFNGPDEIKLKYGWVRYENRAIEPPKMETIEKEEEENKNSKRARN